MWSTDIQFKETLFDKSVSETGEYYRLFQEDRMHSIQKENIQTAVNENITDTAKDTNLI